MKKKYFNSVVLLSLLFAFLLTNSIQASSADLTFSTDEAIEGTDVRLKIGGHIPVNATAFEIEINYNNEAFDYVSVEAPASGAVAVDASENIAGFLTITGNGYLAIGNQELVVLNLRAKEAGVATIALTYSKLFDESGNTIPGTILRYYTITTSDDGDSDTIITTEVETEIVETDPPVEETSTTKVNSEIIVDPSEETPETTTIVEITTDNPTTTISSEITEKTTTTQPRESSTTSSKAENATSEEGTNNSEETTSSKNGTEESSDNISNNSETTPTDEIEKSTRKNILDNKKAILAIIVVATLALIAVIMWRRKLTKRN